MGRPALICTTSAVLATILCACGGSSSGSHAVPAAGASPGSGAPAQNHGGRPGGQRRTLALASCSSNATGSFVGGSVAGYAGGYQSFVGAGYSNAACQGDSSIVAGYDNLVSQGGAESSFIGGGQKNAIDGEYGAYSAIVAGDGNSLSAADASIAGGAANNITADYSSIGGGQSNVVKGAWSFVGGGTTNQNTLGGWFAVIGGGQYNTVGGYYGGAIVGGRQNSVSGTDAFVGGGYTNSVSADYTAIAGGNTNTVTGEYGFIGAGTNNNVSGAGGYIASGGYNTVSGEGAVVDGGYLQTASGAFATVPGGYENVASGTYSFAAGERAQAQQTGTFVWSDGSDGTAFLKSSRAYQFLARASGGFTLYTNAGSTVGAQLSAGSGTWASLSDRDAKTDVVPLDADSVLRKVASLPISSWSYRTQHGVRHVGPMAQDFYAAFNVGEDDKHITSIDEDGVALAAVKALHARVGALDAQNREMRAELRELRVEVRALRSR
ncbi:MAG TPA: tail fiber domain-containing protein [Candidatus Baltobacteraceae bacterium]|nr:tail fiber domain-containing protein [Candidatus Baltobacteraceae bacterium]